MRTDEQAGNKLAVNVKLRTLDIFCKQRGSQLYQTLSVKKIIAKKFLPDPLRYKCVGVEGREGERETLNPLRADIQATGAVFSYSALSQYCGFPELTA